MLKFFRAWRTRANPVSLAICGLILLLIYTNVLSIGVVGDALWSTVLTLAFNVIICGNFYLAFRWSNKRFVDTRQLRPLPPPPPPSDPH